MKITDKRIRCCDCGRYFEPGNREDGIPNGIGFVLEDGTVMNVCSDCILDVGREGRWNGYDKT